MKKFYNTLSTVVAIAGVLAICLIGLSHCANASEYKDAIKSVVKIQMGERLCSAVAFNPPKEAKLPENVTFFITAKHCIEPTVHTGQVIEQWSSGGISSQKLTPFKVIGVSPDTDLAVIASEVDTSFISKLDVATELKATEGDDVISIGYPLGGSRVVTKGVMGTTETQFTPMGVYEDFYHASTLLDSGMSGGALLQKNGNSYELIGIASMKVGPNNFMNSFVTLQDIKKFLGS